MFNGNSAYNWNGNSFADCSYMHADAPVRPVPPWKFGISLAAMMRGAGAV